MCARSDLIDEFLERRAHEVGHAAVVGRQADCAGNGVHRAEIRQRPAIAHHPGHADDAARLGAAQGVLQCRGADEFENLLIARQSNMEKTS